MFCLTCIGQMFATLSLIYWPACLIIVCMYLINTRVFQKKKKSCEDAFYSSRKKNHFSLSAARMHFTPLVKKCIFRCQAVLFLSMKSYDIPPAQKGSFISPIRKQLWMGKYSPR